MRLYCRFTLALVLGGIALLCTGMISASEPAREAQRVQVPQSRQWTMRAPGSGREYTIFVAVPEGPAPPDGYATIYVLDGNSMFLTTVEAVRAYSRRRDADARVRAIVVAIGYPEGVDIAAARAFDLTPDVIEPRSHHPSGGADAFMDFIVHELKPHIAAEFPALPRRTRLVY